MGKVIEHISRLALGLSGVSVVAMMLLVMVNIIARLFKSPIIGTFEITCYLGAVFISFGLMYTQVCHGHIVVEFLVSHLPFRVQAALEIITLFVSVVLVTLVCWQSVKFALVLWESHEVSATLHVPFFPFVFGLAFGAALFCLELLRQCVESVVRLVHK